MSKELVPFKMNMLPAVSEEQLKSLEEVAQGSDFLPRIQLITKGKYVDTSKIGAGHWGIPLPGGDDIDDLGPKIDIIPIAYRPKGLDVSYKDAIIAVYDTEDPEFQRIKAAPKNTGCMWGPSFLVLERSTGKLYELFFGNKSGRNEAAKLRPFLLSQAPASLGIRYKKMPDYGWHVPVITKCSEPFDEAAIKVTQEQINDELEKFQNPEKGVQKVDEKTAAQQSKRAR